LKITNQLAIIGIDKAKPLSQCFSGLAEGQFQQQRGINFIMPEQLTANFGVEYINASSDPAKANRFLITLIDIKSNDERLVDLLTSTAIALSISLWKSESTLITAGSYSK